MRENNVSIGSCKQLGPEPVLPGPGAMAQGRGKELPFLGGGLSLKDVMPGPGEAQPPSRANFNPSGGDD